jgi:serine/threonine protein kinase
VLEYMQGGSLSELLRNNQQPLSENITISIACQVADALVYLHNEMSLVHQDISSSNILLRTPYKKSSFFGGRWLPDCVVADFATAENPTLSQHRDAFGKYIYQPPERRKTPLAKLSFSLDIYSLGILIYEMLVGYTIFHEHATHIDKPLQPLHMYAPKTSPALQRIMHAALDPNPDNRPKAVEMLHLLQQL